MANSSTIYIMNQSLVLWDAEEKINQGDTILW